MTIETRDFGTIEIEADDIVTFVQPIIGFDDLKKFVVLYNQTECPEFVWLQSIEDAEICFILADPRILKEEYAPEMPASVLRDIGDGERMVWLITVITQDISESTVNLRSPIIINPQTRNAAQVVLDSSYDLRQPII